jgi:hypothetical protein
MSTNEKPIGYREFQHNGRTIVSGFTAWSFWAKCGDIYEGGYLSQKSAINAVKRRLDRRDKQSANQNNVRIGNRSSLADPIPDLEDQP